MPEGSHEPVVEFVKRVTGKPVVGVGRFTSPDTMVGMVRRGARLHRGGAAVDCDPYLPAKIDAGRVEDIRECIGCNICISSWHDGVVGTVYPDPSAGEEWRRGWHPERARVAGVGSVLVVGGGPAGLEAALTLGAGVCGDSGRSGPRVRRAVEVRGGAAGMREWFRVVDYRLGQLRKMANVELFAASRRGSRR